MVRRKMKSIEKIYDSGPPVYKAASRHLSRRRGGPNAPTGERLRQDGADGQQSLATMQASSYRNLTRPDQARTSKPGGGVGVLLHKKQSGDLFLHQKMSRSTQRGGGRADRPQVLDQRGGVVLDADKSGHFMTVQSHKPGPNAALLEVASIRGPSLRDGSKT